MRRARSGAALICAALTVLATSAAFADAGSSPVRQVSQGDPLASCTIGTSTGRSYPSAEVEPYIAVNPNDPRQAIGTFQQDRYSNGGAKGGGVVFTHDGHNWGETVLPFGACAPNTTSNYSRESDFWVSWGPDNVAYATALQVDRGLPTPSNRVGMAVTTTFDGGATWTNSQGVIDDNDPAFFDDKNSITADLDRPGSAYVVWDRLFQPLDATGNATAFDGPAMISLTRDHGKTWSKPAVMVDTSGVQFSQTLGNVIVEDPRTGTLYDFYDRQTYNDANTDVQIDAHFEVVKSTDGGVTWSKPTRVATDSSVQEVDPNVPSVLIRAGSGLPSPGIDPVTGELYLAYMGTDFSGGALDQIELVRSADGAATWSAPSRVSGDPNALATTPSIAVDQTGTVAITYYDARHLQPGNTTTLPASTWLQSFPRDHPDQATEHQIFPDFDWLQAPFAGFGHMLGDYEGIAATSAFGVQPLFVTTANAPADRTDVYTGFFFGPFGAPAPGGAVIPPGLATLMKGTHGAHKTYN